MNNARPLAAVRPPRSWPKFRPSMSRRGLDDRRQAVEGRPEDGKPRRTLTVVFRAS